VVAVRLDGKPLGVVGLDGAGVPGLELPALAAGPHVLELGAPGTAGVQADLRLSWRTAADPVAVASGLEVTLATPADPVQVGRRGRFALRLRNPGAEPIAMPTAVVPVPPGFRADGDSLLELKRRGLIARYEDQGSELQLYLTALDAGATIELPYALEAEAPCRVTQRAAQAYAYYDPETRGASAAAVIAASPR
jgi:hypothetical protein